MAKMEKARFYADLNPRYGAKGEGRYAVFVSYDVRDGRTATGRRRAIANVATAKTTNSRVVAEGRAERLAAVFDELDGIFVEVEV